MHLSLSLYIYTETSSCSIRKASPTSCTPDLVRTSSKPFIRLIRLTVAFPLSARAIRMESASLEVFMAFCSFGWRFVGGGLALDRRTAILVLACCARVKFFLPFARIKSPCLVF